ncbi:hypothetical protein GCM10009603_09130 [Nocardiopsis exhalans]
MSTAPRAPDRAPGAPPWGGVLVFWLEKAVAGAHRADGLLVPAPTAPAPRPAVPAPTAPAPRPAHPEPPPCSREKGVTHA